MDVAEEWCASFCLVCEQSSPGGDFCSPHCCISNYQTLAHSSTNSTADTDTTASPCVEQPYTHSPRQGPRFPAWSPLERPWSSYSHAENHSPNPAISDFGHFNLLVPKPRLDSHYRFRPPSPYSTSHLMHRDHQDGIIPYVSIAGLPHSDHSNPEHSDTSASSADLAQAQAPVTASTHCRQRQGGTRSEAQSSSLHRRPGRRNSRSKVHKTAQHRQLLPWETMEQTRLARRRENCDDDI